MEKIDSIDVNLKIQREDFVYLFTSQLDLLKNEVQKLIDVYYPVYITFIDKGNVNPTEAWIAIKNLFVSQETQIEKRTKSNN